MGVTTNPKWQEEDKVLFKALEIALDEYEMHLENISKQKCMIGQNQNCILPIIMSVKTLDIKLE